MAIKAIVDADELEKFARELQKFNNDLQERTIRIRGQFSQLGETWRDQEHQKFATEFQQAMQAMDRFMKVSNPHVKLLIKKAGIIRDYAQKH